MARSRRAFTLMELLVSVAIVALLLSLVLPAIGRTLATSRKFKCQQSLRSVAYDFAIFADDELHGFRGNGSRTSERTFEIENFVESQYSVHEFWAWPGETRHEVPDAAGNDPMRCSEMKGELELRSNLPCSNGAIGPRQNISFGFNIRLRIVEGTEPGMWNWATLTQNVLQASRVPLVWDVDGEVADSRNLSPLFSGPALDSPELFVGDAYWFPGMRHLGGANFAFIDGHVESSAKPLEQPTWAWEFSPRR